jgi:CDP-diacylglycerol--serine O-phosphatidyltransferase
VTALALCCGLSGVRFAISEDWERAVLMIIIAGVLDGLDGRIARMLKGQSRFGAELDSLADVISFGVSPAIIMYLWSLQFVPRFGWLFALAYAVCMALRLARFNAHIDVEDQPHKSAGFLTGVPAPAGAGLLLLPLYLWLWLGEPIVQEFYVVAPWTALIAFLAISNLATFSWASLRLRRHVRFGALVVIALIGGALLTAPWVTLSLASLIYAGMIPASILSYSKVKRQRAAASVRSGPLPAEDAR